jgi:hypothetical protein
MDIDRRQAGREGGRAYVGVERADMCIQHLITVVSCLVSRVSFLVSRFSCLVSRVSFLVSRFSCLVSCFVPSGFMPVDSPTRLPWEGKEGDRMLRWVSDEGRFMGEGVSCIVYSS